MNTLQEELDRSFGDGPPLAPVGSHVAAGRRALVRRRAASGVAGLATAAVLATGGYALSPGQPSDSGQVAGPASSATPSVTPPTTDPADAPWGRGELIRYVGDELQVRPKVIVHEHIHNPHGYAPPGLSDALDVTWRGERQWLMIETQRPGGGSMSSAEPSNGWASFAAYVADQAGTGSGSGWPDTMRLNGGGQVVATAGTRVLDRTNDPQLGATFAPDGATVGAAIVSVAAENGRYFVVWRVLDGSLDVITTGPDDVGDATLEELLVDARAKYDSGEGLR